MRVFDNARIVIYRINRKGLEVFLLKEKAEGEDKWRIPEGILKYKKEDLIELDELELEDGQTHQAIAMEADWHEIPSVRAIIKEDVRIVKDTIKTGMEQGTYVSVKEAFKKVLPHEYKWLKELKDVVLDRNQANSI